MWSNHEVGLEFPLSSSYLQGWNNLSEVSTRLLGIFEVKILGTSAAIPTNSRRPSAQVVTMYDRHHLVDCGEGTQIEMLRRKVRFSRLDAIFISHLHGDHVLGLPGLLTTLSLYERNFPLKLFGPAGLRDMIDVIFAQTQSYLSYELEFFPLEEFDVGEAIYTTDRYEVILLPLQHRIFCRGFLFREHSKPPKFDFYKAKALEIPNKYFKLLKQGNRVTIDDGRVIDPTQVLGDPEPVMSYAYCSDTRYFEGLVEHIRDVKVLYHEATFLENLASRAAETFHSTAKQAATIAKMADAGSLYIGHFSARYIELDALLEEARSVFARTELAREGLMIDLKNPKKEEAGESK